MRGPRIWICAALLAWGAAVAASESDPFGGLADPTRPLASTPAREATQNAPRQSRLVLQSVLISPWSRHAIISGKKVGVGDRLGDAQVLEIRPHEVVIRRGDNTQTLRLLAGAAQTKEETHE